MKNEHDSEVALSKSVPKEFSACGWTLELRDPFALDNPEGVIEYLAKNASLMLSKSSENIHARELQAQIQRFMNANNEHHQDSSDLAYRKALVAMFLVGVSARSLEEEQRFPNERKVAVLRKELGQLQRFGIMQEAIKEDVIEFKTVKTLTCNYAREKWIEDTEKKIRTGDMAQIVWEWMANDPRLVEQRPETMDGLKVWIREVAVDFPHAQKRGRPKREKN